MGQFFTRVAGMAFFFRTLLSHWQLMGQSERCFWRSFFVAGTIFGELGRRFERVESKVSFCETVAEFDIGHDDDFSCLGLIFCGGRSTL